MRQMPRLLKAANLELVASNPYILTEVGRADFWMPAVESFERLLPASGVVTEAEAKELVADLLEDSRQGVFFGSSNYYSYVAKRRR